MSDAPAPQGPPVVRDERRAGVALITLDRPDQLNAWTPAMATQFFAALDGAVADPSVRAIVVTGAGRGFCAGLDMELLGELRRDPGRGPVTSTGARRFSEIARAPKPVIAAINGAAAGIGFCIAVYADVRFVASNAKLTSAFSRRGLPAENGLAWALPRIVGAGHAADLLLSGRVITAAEALSMGLVSAVVEPDALLDQALAYAADLAANVSPRSMATMKSALLAADDETLADAESGALEATKAALLSADFAEGVDSYVERRAPAFPPLGNA
jgi:enoyl-CoA hydratase/carnithine racemase